MSFCQNFCHLDPNIPNGKNFATFGKWQNFCPFALLHFGSKHYLSPALTTLVESSMAIA
jgi:hypothetical protein